MTIHRPIYLALLEALSALFNGGFYADKVIEKFFKQHRKWGSRDRRQFAQTLYDIVRRWRFLLYVAGYDQVPTAPMSSHVFSAVLVAYIVIETSFEGPEAEVGQKHGVQGLLQELGVSAKDLEILKQRAHAADLPRCVVESVPDWLDQVGEKELQDKWPGTLIALNQKAPIFLRTNTLKTTRDKLSAALHAEGVETVPLPDSDVGLQLKERANVFATRCFKNGWFEMQDGGSQKIAPLLAVSEELLASSTAAGAALRVIDACAGAGGKTLHLAALMQNKGKIIALDVHEQKLAELKKRIARASASNVEVRQIDSSKVVKRLEGTADRLLLDVPCSGSGVIRRNPDSKWKLTEPRFVELQQIQYQLLRDYSPMLKPGGKMVYATCSIWPSENERQIQKFLAAHGGQWRLEQEIHISPTDSPFDGFYAARLGRL